METLINQSNLKEAHSRGKEGTRDFNCYCTSLFVLEQRDKLYWVDCPEITKFINSNTIQVNELLKGDLLVMYNADSYNDYPDEQDEEGLIIIHTAVYLGKGKWFHKEGGSRSSYGEKENVLNAYNYEKWEYRRIKK